VKPALLCLVVLVLSAVAFGITPSNASLSGTYAINYHSASYNSWFAQVSCPHYTGSLYAGSTTTNEVVDGKIIFDAKGSVPSFSVYQYSHFNQALSNATPTWACDPNGNPYITNPGYAVYDAPIPDSGTGTYSIQSDYTGQMNLSGVSGTFVLRIAATNTKGLASDFMFHGTKSDNSADGDGLGVKQ